jgi:hypothetical protein
MKAYEKYERLVAKLTKEINSGSQNTVVSYGRKSKVLGKSGQQHQIDVVVKRKDLNVLIECKHWNRKVEPMVVLTLVGRLFDIGQAYGSLPPFNSTLRAAIATKKGFSSGAERLANFFCVDTWHVKSLHEAVIKLRGLIGTRIADDANRYADGVEVENKSVTPRILNPLPRRCLKPLFGISPRKFAQ